MPTRLTGTLKRLRAHYGKPPRPVAKTGLEMVLWENVAYLVDDERRATVFAALKSRIGLSAQRIADATTRALLDVTLLGGAGFAANQVKKLRRIAEIVLTKLDGDLDEAIKLPVPQAKRALMLFPGFGEPGAEKVLLMTGAAPILALDSNAMRVLQRLGYGEAKKSYPATYRSVQAAAAAELPRKVATLKEAHLLLRRHGKELCKATHPRCEMCPVSGLCEYFDRMSGGRKGGREEGRKKERREGGR